MRRATILIATFLTALLAGAGIAQAKGVMGEASINGPGAGGSGGGGIHFDGEDPSDDGFWTLLQETGVMSAVDGSSYEAGGTPPAGGMGPRYTLNWDLEQFEGPDVSFVQYVYPYAGDEAWIFTPRTVDLEVGEIPAGWHRTGSNSLRYQLERYGLPRINPEASAAGGAAQAATQAEETQNYFLPVAIVAGLIAVIVIAGRRISPRARTT